MAIVILILQIPSIGISAAYQNDYNGAMAGDGAGIYAHGVDLSEWQGPSVDFEKIKAQGYSFVILRAGYSVYTDEYFERNYAEAKKAGLNVGVYLYSYADTVEEVLREAEALKGWLKGKTLEYPVYYDMEEPETHGKMPAAALTELSLAFLDSMAADGWLVGLYSCRSWLESKLETDKICANYECWMAMYLPSGSYDTYDRYDEYCGMWQYSSTGKVDGVPGNVDMNIAFKDYPAICMQYGFNGYESSGVTFDLVGNAQVPGVIACGESIPVSGRVISKEGKLTNVTVGIFNAAGEMLTGRSAGPRTESYDISALAAGVKAETLPIGMYIYRVVATNSRGTRILLQQQLVISRSGVASGDLQIPQDLKEGTLFKPSGRLLASTKILEVKITICKEDGTEIIAAKSNPNAKSYDIAALADSFDTSGLKLGTYVYKIRVSTEKNTENICDEVFSVWVASDPIKSEGFALKSEYQLGELTSLSGKIVSNKSDLREVEVKITRNNQEGEPLSAVLKGGRELSLDRFSEVLDFVSLTYGSYVCTITATNDAGPTLVINRAFTIRTDGMSLCDFVPPTTIYAGDSFELGGAIASDYTALKFVSVSVLNENMQVMFDAAVCLQSMVFDLSELSPKLPFSSLHTGDYLLRVVAENQTEKEILYNSIFTVTDKTDCINWIDMRYSVYGITFFDCDSMQFYGTIQSQESDISHITAEIFSTDGVLLYYTEKSPMKKTFSMKEFDKSLRISVLQPGEYRLIVTAENESGTFVLAADLFEISACAHSNVATGVCYEQRCDRIGAICGSRCLDCGALVRYGSALPANEHNWLLENCLHCGTKQPQQLTLQQSQTLRHNGRYMLAYCVDGQWIALDRTGKTVSIPTPDENGNVTVSASLLWTPMIRKGQIRLLNSDEKSLHLDSNGIFVAAGKQNAVFSLEEKNGHFTLGLAQLERYICVENSVFTVGDVPTEIVIFELPRNRE